MIIDAVLNAKRILEMQPGYSMPLRQLHAQLVRELGPGAGSYSEIYQQLRRKSDCFALLNAPRVLGGHAWPGTVREQYENALEHVGLGACTRVTLTDPPVQDSAADLIAVLSATLGEIVSQADGDEALAAYIESATIDLEQLNRVITGAGTTLPTTPPPGPPPTT
jgi:hypothetical protein